MTGGRLKCTISFILLALMVLTLPVNAQEKKVFYQISVEKNGSARFVVRDIIPLASTQEVEAFRKVVDNFNESAYLQDFKIRMSNLISKASVHTGRTMSGDGYSVNIDLVEGLSPYDAITYSFTWKNFANTENGSIVIGDVFEGGLYLFRDDAFFITIPSGYRAETIIPQPDEVSDGTLRWYGPRNFGNGEPTVVLTPVKIQDHGGEQAGKESGSSSSYILPVLLPFIAVGIAVVAFRKLRASGEKSINDRPRTDEEIVLDILRERREILQSDIVRLTGFSKSKVSNIIALLKKRGVVEKVRMGRENMIRYKGD